MKRRKILGPVLTTIALTLGTLAVPLSVSADPPAAATAAAPEALADLVAVVDQGPRGNGFKGQKIQFLKRDGDWSSGDDAAPWTLHIPTGPGWGHITDVKTRIAPDGGQIVLVSAGGGRVGAFTYPGGEPVWSADTRNSGCGKKHNPHSIEIVPRVPGVSDGGQYVVADSAGYVIYYPVGAAKPKCYKLKSAHGALYSDGRIWAVGYNGLVQYDIGERSLEKAGKMLTVAGFKGGHDLAPVRGSASHEMWVTDHSRVYTFDKYASDRPGDRRFTVVPRPKGGSCVKGLGNSGAELLMTRPCRTHETDDPPATRCEKKYQTHVVDFYDAAGNREKKRRASGCFYKARPVSWDYY